MLRQPFLAQGKSMVQASNISLWMEQLPAESLQPREPLRGRLQADVVIIGAGYTGLWTAYYLKRSQPALRVVVLEAQIAGYGASGRNGGWVMGELAGEDALLAGLDAATRQRCRTVLRDIPDEVGRVLARERLDCDFRKGGVLYCAARYPEQEQLLREQLADWRRYGHGEDDFRWLDSAALQQQLRLAGAYGAVYSPHVATIQPARLVRALARRVEEMGVLLFEHSPVLRIEGREAVTAQGRVSGEWLVPAVEAYAATLGGVRSRQIAVQSLIIATEPLPQALWDEIGLANGQAFSDFGHLVSYGQRSADNRLILGARGGYRFGGRLRQSFTLSAAEIAQRQQLLQTLFPMLAGVRISHGWGGNLGMARGFHPQIVVDRDRGMLQAGGYGGEGVGASNLAGRTMAALIGGEAGELAQLPWLTTPAACRRWEPEPLRWLGYQAILRSFNWEERVLLQPGAPAWQRRLVQRVAAGMAGLLQ